VTANGARCRNCGVEVIRVQRRDGRICPSCAKIAQQDRDRRRYLTQKKASHGPTATYLMADDAFRRQRADATLEAGQCKRHCPCGRIYPLPTMEAPCPDCGAHLVLCPTTFTEAA
jgi:hypothetical protein